MNYLKIYLLNLLFCIPFFSSAQTKAYIENLKIENIKDSILIITFDLEKTKKNELFDFELVAKEQGSNFIEPIGLTGDLKQQYSGKSKKIVWPLTNNLTEFNGFLKLEIRGLNAKFEELKSESKLVRVQKEWKSKSVQNSDPENEKLAKIQWILPEKRVETINTEEYSIHACIDSEIKISQINVFINNDLISNDRAFKPISGNCPNTIKKTFTLQEGLNEIRLQIIDVEGIETSSFLLVTRIIEE